MPSLKFSKLSDVDRLEGWIIQKARIVGANLVLEMSSLLADKPVELTVQPTITVSMSGNVTLHNPGLALTAKDIEEEKTEG